jgi:hypothetical protein
MGYRLFRRLSCLALASALLLSAQSISKNRRTSVRRGEWSSKTVSLFNTWGGLDSNPGRRLSLASPDGKKIIEVRNERVGIVVDGKAYRTKLGEKTNAELGWAPDSQYFFLTWTDGGDTGTWHTDLYSVGASGIRQIDKFENQVRSEFEQRIRHLPMPKEFGRSVDRHFWQEAQYCEANIVGAEWLNGSQELLVSALVPNVGDCRYMSTFGVYRVAVPSGNILQHYKAHEAYKKFDRKNLPRITE